MVCVRSWVSGFVLRMPMVEVSEVSERSQPGSLVVRRRSGRGSVRVEVGKRPALFVYPIFHAVVFRDGRKLAS